LGSGRRGNLMVQVVIETPTKLTATQEQMLRDYAKTEDRSVLPRSRSFFEKIRDHFAKSPGKPR
jgi:molecular chaperone DnaJ